MWSTTALRSKPGRFDSDSGRPRALTSWALSLAAHGMVGLALLVVAPRLALPPESNVFTWHVALVSHSSSEAQAASQSPETPPSHPASPQAPGRAVARVAPRSPSPPGQALSAAIQPLPPAPMSPAVAQVAEESIQNSEVPSGPVGLPQRAQLDASILPTHEAEAPAQGTAPADDQRIATLAEVAPETIRASTAEPASDARPSPMGQTPATTLATISQAVPVVAAVSPPAPPATTPSPASDSDSGAEPASPATAQAPRMAAAEPNPTVADLKAEQAMEPAAQRRDYGWLVSSLRHRIVGLKRYPLEARANRMQGRVVVLAVISDTGDLLDATIAQTSGFEVLDRDALDLVRKSCPLTLRESILQPQVVLRVPVSYHLTN